MSSEEHQNYPSSSCESDTSHLATEERLSTEPPSTSQPTTRQASPVSENESSVAQEEPRRRRRKLNKARGEPPRNSQGKLYCDHADCATKAPVFARRCEWRQAHPRCLGYYLQIADLSAASTWTGMSVRTDAPSQAARSSGDSPIQVDSCVMSGRCTRSTEARRSL